MNIVTVFFSFFLYKRVLVNSGEVVVVVVVMEAEAEAGMKVEAVVVVVARVYI